MAASDFKYDVAFSFLTVDESVATQLHAKLKGRLSSFLYTDAARQREIGGRDGDEAYGRVFGEEARTVVVLYRSGWGDKGFTQIESTAIRNRGFDHGHEFLTFINRDNSPLPKWLPKSRVWVGLDRFGVDHAATVIESRVQEAGGEPYDETAIARAERMQVEHLAENDRQLFLDSQDGAKAALEGCQRIFEYIESLSAASHGQILPPKRVSGISFTFEIYAAYSQWKISVAWAPWASNTTSRAQLHVKEWRGTIFDFEGDGPEVPKPKRSTLFVFDYRGGKPGWHEKSVTARFYRHEELADWIGNRLLKRIEEARTRGE